MVRLSFVERFALAVDPRASRPTSDHSTKISLAEAADLADALLTDNASERAGDLQQAQLIASTPSYFATSAARDILTRALTAPQGSNQQKMTQVANDAQALFGKLPGRCVVARLPSNGYRPVLVYVPADFDAKKPVKTLTYFHGNDANIGSTPAQNGLFAQIKREAPGSNTVFILPQGKLTGASHDWMKSSAGESFAGLEAQALELAQDLAGGHFVPKTRIVAAHSGGGSPLSNAARSGELDADQLITMDCFYESDGRQYWIDVANWAAGVKHALAITDVCATNDKARHDEFETIATRNPKVKVSRKTTTLAHGALPGAFTSPVV